MPQTSDGRTKEEVLISHAPKLQADVREQKKKESLNMIFHALKHRLEKNESLKP